jgi:hypothetical protein
MEYSTTRTQDPQTSGQRLELQRRLLALAETAGQSGAVKGLAKLVKMYSSDTVQKQILIWLERYTAVRQAESGDGRMHFQVPEHLRGGALGLGGARLNPYWTIELPRAAPTRLPSTVRSESPERKRPLSERELLDKRLKQAFEDFVEHRDRAHKETLLRVIEEVPFKGDFERGPRSSPTVQGGAPGLRQQRRIL